MCVWWCVFYIVVGLDPVTNQEDRDERDDDQRNNIQSDPKNNSKKKETKKTNPYRVSGFSI